MSSFNFLDIVKDLNPFYDTFKKHKADDLYEDSEERSVGKSEEQVYLLGD